MHRTGNAQKEPYRRKQLVFEELLLEQQSGPGGRPGQVGGVAAGVQMAQVVEDETPFPVFYQPGHPDADASGQVLGSNVDLFQELVDMQVIERSFDANLTGAAELPRHVAEHHHQHEPLRTLTHDRTRSRLPRFDRRLRRRELPEGDHAGDGRARPLHDRPAEGRRRARRPSRSSDTGEMAGASRACSKALSARCSRCRRTRRTRCAR
jgi:flagellar basal body rod protein FlgC